MNIFSWLNDILYKKTGRLLQTVDDESEFQPYMVQRWASMYSPNMAKILNLTTNRLYDAYIDKTMWYEAFLGIVPKSRFKKIQYIKKIKEDTKQDDYQEKIELLARSHNISRREVEIYINEFNIDLSSIKTNRS